MRNHRCETSFDRDGILRLLWGDPIGSLTTRAATRLLIGDEYVDLQHLAAGVQHAKATMLLTGGELSPKDVLPITWEKLLAFLTPAPGCSEITRER